MRTCHSSVTAALEKSVDASGTEVLQTAYSFAARLEALSLLDTAGCFCSCSEFAFRTFVAGKNKNVTKSQSIVAAARLNLPLTAGAGQKCHGHAHGPAGRWFSNCKSKSGTSQLPRLRVTMIGKPQALVYDILPSTEGAGKRCSECD